MPEQKSEHINLPKEGNVRITGQASNITEKEIHDDRQAIINQLHSAYIDVAKTMKPYQDEWDNSHILAMEDALWAGFKAGCTEWGEDSADLFEKETWTAFADKITDAAGNAYDAASQFAIVQQKKIVKNVNEALNDMDTLIDHPVDTLKTWGWHVYEDDIVKPLYRYKELAMDAADSVGNTIDSVGEAAEAAQRIYGHKDAILNLPNQVSRADVNGIETFIDTVLVDIDPELAKAIKNNPNLPTILGLIADHNTALAYMSYANLFFEAVPPNFYAYIASKGGTYVVIEVILLVVTAIFTAGAATAARLAAIAVRITAAGNKVVKVVTNGAVFSRAIAAFTKMLKVFEQVVKDLLALGEKLGRKRSRSVAESGASETEIQTTRKIEKRDHHCTICLSTKHSTPHGPKGSVVYD